MLEANMTPSSLSKHELRELREKRGITPAQVQQATDGLIDIDLVLDLERGIGRFGALTPEQREIYWSLLQPDEIGSDGKKKLNGKMRRKSKRDFFPRRRLGRPTEDLAPAAPPEAPKLEDFKPTHDTPMMRETAAVLRDEARNHYRQGVAHIEEALRKYRLASELEGSQLAFADLLEGMAKVLRYLD